MAERKAAVEERTEVSPAPRWASWSRRLLPWGIGVLVLLAGFALQTQLYSGQERIVISVFMFVALAQSWNLIGGYTGYATFGQVVFFGLGGYTTAVLMSHVGASFWLSMVASAVVCLLFGALIGLPLLRLKGHYFAVAALGVAEGMREVVTNLPKLTGGGAGLTVPTFGAEAPTTYLGNDGFYVLFLLVAAFAVLVVGFISRSRFGFALRAINQDEEAAASMGVNTTWSKVAAFAISGLIGGVAGSSYAFQIVTIYPDRLFDVEITVLMVVMVVIGGSGTVVGPVVGAIGLQFLSEWLRHSYTMYHTFILGGIIILAVILFPEGLVTYFRQAMRTGGWSLLSTVRRYRL
ncbi:MAG: branched-chain amino acid ABC transporter permease [Streptosporangiaceae bacterium]